MDKKYGKLIIIFLIILTIYGLIIYFVFGGKKNNKDDKKGNNSNPTEKPTNPDIPKSEIDAIVFINDNGIVTHSDHGWEIGNTTILSGKKFDIYENNSLIGNYRVLYNKIWKLYDSGNNPVDYEGSIIGIDTDLDYKVISLYNENVTSEDKKTVSEFLDKKKIKYDIDSLSIARHTYDFNQDGIRDDILYSASYSTDLDDSSSTGDTFSTIFIKSINSYQEIYFSKNKSLLYSLKAFFSLKNEKYLLFSGEYPSDSGYNLRLYKVTDKIEEELESDFK